MQIKFYNHDDSKISLKSEMMSVHPSIILADTPEISNTSCTGQLRLQTGCESANEKLISFLL